MGVPPGIPLRAVQPRYHHPDRPQHIFFYSKKQQPTVHLVPWWQTQLMISEKKPSNRSPGSISNPLVSLNHHEIPLNHHKITIKSPWNHHKITMKSLHNHHEITIKSPWNHHKTTIKSPWNHHKIFTKSPWNHHKITTKSGLLRQGLDRKITSQGIQVKT